jgi:hypothetical protein
MISNCRQQRETSAGAMAIYSKEEVPIGEQVFGTSFLPHPLPKYKFSQQETAPNAAY